MDFVIGMGFVLCMLYLFYEREGRKRPRAQTVRAARGGGGSRGKRTTKRRTTRKAEMITFQP
jgi:hypothetical protein